MNTTLEAEWRIAFKWSPSRLSTRAAIITLAASPVAYFGLSAILADRLSRPTRKPLTITPADFGLAYEDVRFTSSVDHISLEGWYANSRSGKAILVLHGLESARSDADASCMRIMQALVQSGYGVLVFDFRGHGESGGSHFSLGQLEARDVDGALGFLKGRGVTQVGILGFSMGAVAALNAAPEHPEVRAIVSDSAFAAASPLIAAELPKRTGLPRLFNAGILLMARALYGLDLAANRPELQIARLLDRPVFLIHGEADSIIPLWHAYALRKAGGGNPNVRLWVVPGADHAGAYKQDPEEYLQRVITFFDEALT